LWVLLSVEQFRGIDRETFGRVLAGHVTMPFLAAGIARLLALSPELTVGFAVLGAVTPELVTPVMTDLSGGIGADGGSHHRRRDGRQRRRRPVEPGASDRRGSGRRGAERRGLRRRLSRRRRAPRSARIAAVLSVGMRDFAVAAALVVAGGLPTIASLPAVAFGVVEMVSSAGLARWLSSER
jgi:hypothetical protein